QQLDMNTISWGQHPETPDTPSFPVLKWTLAACVAIGLSLSIGISFLREMMDTSVRSPRDIARVGQMNLLGMIPHEDDDPQSAGVPLPTVIYGAPTSMMAQQFRAVRTRLHPHDGRAVPPGPHAPPACRVARYHSQHPGYQPRPRRRQEHHCLQPRR